MATFVYPSFKGRQMGTGAQIDLDTDVIKGMLVPASYVTTAQATLDTHAFRSSVTEVTGTGYTAGGQALASKTLTASGTNFVWDFADPSWPNSTITARGIVFYKDTGAAATDPLIGLWDFGADITSTNGAFTVQVDPTGALLIS